MCFFQDGLVWFQRKTSSHSKIFANEETTTVQGDIGIDDAQELQRLMIKDTKWFTFSQTSTSIGSGTFSGSSTDPAVTVPTSKKYVHWFN